MAKQFEVLSSLVPKNTGIAVLVNPSNPPLAQPQLRDVEAAAKTLGRKIHVLKAATERDIDAAFEAVAQLRAGALLVCTDNFFFAQRKQIVALAARHAVPALYPYRDFPVSGGLMSYGASLPEAYRLAGVYTGQILSGKAVAELPIVRPTIIQFVINRKIASTLGLKIPQELLLRADELIE